MANKMVLRRDDALVVTQGVTLACSGLAGLFVSRYIFGETGITVSFGWLIAQVCVGLYAALIALGIGRTRKIKEETK